VSEASTEEPSKGYEGSEGLGGNGKRRRKISQKKTIKKGKKRTERAVEVGD